MSESERSIQSLSKCIKRGNEKMKRNRLKECVVVSVSVTQDSNVKMMATTQSIRTEAKAEVKKKQVAKPRKKGEVYKAFQSEFELNEKDRG